MNFAKIKKWFQRHRNVRCPAEERPAPTPREAKVPLNEPGPDPVPLKPPAGPISGRKKGPPEKRKRARPSAAASSSGRSVSSRPLSRQGIPILKPDEDLEAHFRDAAGDQTHRDQASGRGGVSERRKAVDRPSSRRPTAPLQHDRAGIRRLEDDADLRAYFLTGASEAAEPQTTVPQETADTEHTTRAPLTNVPTDRHGIPRLDNRVDLNRLFDAAVDATEDGEALGEALRRSLDHDARGLMKKKTGGFFPPRRLSLKEKLRRYPSPQAQLDLHGATAAQARQRTEAFIRSARVDGLLTVRIIVGKGLHSEDGAVLPDVIEDLLVALKRVDLVLSYCWDKRIKRKSGAVIVYLTADDR